MKPVRRSLCLLLALMLVFATATTAFAAGTNTITVKNAVGGQKYELYKMLDLVVNADQTAYSYTVNSAWADFFKAGSEGVAAGAGRTYVNIDAQGYVTWKENADVAAFAKAAEAFAKSNNLSALKTNNPTTDGDITFTELEPGYYLITSTLGTNASVGTTPGNPNPEIAEKNQAPTSTKTVEEDATKQYGAKNDADIGQTVNFKATITAQPGAENYVFHDKMSAGLTFAGIDKVTVKVGDTALTKDTDYTISAGTKEENPCTFEIAFKQDYLDKITSETTITIEYSATLNENAVIAGDGNPNDIHLDYGDENNTKSTPTSQTRTYTWEFKVFKYTTKDGKEVALTGAKFKLSTDAKGESVISLVDITEENATTKTYRRATDDDKTTVTEIEVGSDGKLVIQGLDADTYYLTETKAPDGYNKLAAPIKVTIDSDGNVKKDDDTSALDDKTVKVENKSGTELPSTGGMGTTIFYVLGSVLVLAAVVLLVTRRRMRREG